MCRCKTIKDRQRGEVIAALLFSDDALCCVATRALLLQAQLGAKKETQR
jgi:hypothetical protein